MRTFLVTGATGKQGGAVINALLSSVHTPADIRAFTRDPQSAAAKHLSSRGIHVVKGDLYDRQSILAALNNVNVAYLVTDFTSERGVEGEVEQGKLFVDCASEAGVSHIVFSSVAGAEEAPEVDHFHSKYKIEQCIRGVSSLGWTMLRPTSFLENMPPPGIGRFMYLGVLRGLFGCDRVWHIACEDIGKAAAKAMLEPEQYNGRIVNLVSETANADEVQAALDRAEGYKSWKMWVPQWFVLAIMPHHFKQMFQWLIVQYAHGTMPGTVEETKALVPDALDIESWGRKQKMQREAAAAKKTA